MDLLHKRYASPYFFLDGMIQAGRFEEFVVNFVETVTEEENEKTTWEFFLHKVFDDRTYTAFKDEIRNNEEHKNLSARTIETTVNHSFDILNSFNPEEKGGE
jgi:hypothetical protein